MQTEEVKMGEAMGAAMEGVARVAAAMAAAVRAVEAMAAVAMAAVAMAAVTVVVSEAGRAAKAVMVRVPSF